MQFKHYTVSSTTTPEFLRKYVHPDFSCLATIFSCGSASTGLQFDMARHGNGEMMEV